MYFLSLIEAIVLITNGFAILNEKRVLKKCINKMNIN